MLFTHLLRVRDVFNIDVFVVIVFVIVFCCFFCLFVFYPHILFATVLLTFRFRNFCVRYRIPTDEGPF